MLELDKQIGLLVKILERLFFFLWIELGLTHLFECYKRLRGKTFIPGFIDSTEAAFADHFNNTVALIKDVASRQRASNMTTR